MFVKDLLKKLLFDCPPSSAVLMFHHLSMHPDIDRSGCKLSEEDFKRQISQYSNYVSLPKLVFGHTSNHLAITFDDGLVDVYTVAYPYLKSRQIPFTIFIVSDFINQEGYLTMDQLLELSHDPLVTVGSHGITHATLTGLTKEEKTNEILSSKTILEQILVKRVDIFAYSHGAFDSDCISILKASNYVCAMGVQAIPYNIFTKRLTYHLPRFNIDSDSIVDANIKLSKIFRGKS